MTRTPTTVILQCLKRATMPYSALIGRILTMKLPRETGYRAQMSPCVL